MLGVGDRGLGGGGGWGVSGGGIERRERVRELKAPVPGFSFETRVAGQVTKTRGAFASTHLRSPAGLPAPAFSFHAARRCCRLSANVYETVGRWLKKEEEDEHGGGGRGGGGVWKEEEDQRGGKQNNDHRNRRISVPPRTAAATSAVRKLPNHSWLFWHRASPALWHVNKKRLRQ